MLLNQAVLALAAAALCARWRADAAPSAVRLCGRELGKIMSRVCIVYNSPAWDVPTVVEQPAAVARRKRDAGIAEECCNYGCTWDQLAEYCEIPNTEDFISDLDTHMIADRSAEKEVVPSVVAAPRQARAPAASATRVEHAASTAHAAHAAGSASEARVASAARGRARMRQREVGRTHGYGRSRSRRCWCRRKRRSDRRRASLMGSRKKCRARCSRRRHRVPAANVGADPQHRLSTTRQKPLCVRRSLQQVGRSP